MSYLLDKKTKRDRYFRYGVAVALLVILFYFRAGIFGGLSYISDIVFHPVLVLGRNIGERLGNKTAYFASKNSLNIRNQELESRIKNEEARIANYNSILSENESLKEMLGRKTTKSPTVLSTVISEPNQSIYDTLLVDAGAREGIKEGSMVFARGSIPVGRVALVNANSSKVVLFSSSGEKMEVVVSEKNAVMSLAGRGGGNFEMVMPKDFTLEPGAQVVLPGINPYLVAVVEKIISDPRDPFTKALLVSPVNMREIKFVEIDISAR